MGKLELKTDARMKRKKRIRKKIKGTADRPRLCVFRSSKHIYAQLIDDTTGNTLASAGSVEKNIKDMFAKIEGKIAKAELIGKAIGERALEKGVQKVVFDRSGFQYHGRVKALSDGARKAGLTF